MQWIIAARQPVLVARIGNYFVQILNLGGKELEARAGIEPAHKGFADLSLTTWVPRPGRLPKTPGSSQTSPASMPQLSTVWSGRRDLNSRPSPWQGDALPLS